jgi:two-component system phosphate regulon response regulator PhoB
MTTEIRQVGAITREEEFAARPDSSAPLVLVAEDHEDTRFLLRYLLEARGYRVAEAADGEEAVDLAELIRPDLVLMDGGLPRLDGLEAARRIRRLPSPVRVPIVFLSGHAGPAFRAAASAAGCDDYLTKPFEVKQLEKVLRRHVGGRASSGI